MATLNFIASTGRCGTHFLSALMRDHAGETLVLREAIGWKYRPRLAFSFRDYERLAQDDPVLDAHLARISRHAREGTRYYEVGWPAFAWLPYFLEKYAADFAFVHVVRNPFIFAASMMTHDYFAGRADGYAEYGTLQATDPGSPYFELADVYPAYSPYEKCLCH